MHIDAPSVKTWRTFITHGEGVVVSHHFLGEGDQRHDAHQSFDDESSATCSNQQSYTLMLPVSKHDDHLSSEDELCYH